MRPGYITLVAFTQILACIPFLICFSHRSEWKFDFCLVFFFFFFLAEAQLQEQLVNLTTDIVLMATGAVFFGFWALVTVKRWGDQSEKSGKTQVCQNTWKDLTQRPRSCCTICMNTSGQILFSHAIHRPAAAVLIGEVATQVWYWTGALATWMNNTEFWATW